MSSRSSLRVARASRPCVVRIMHLALFRKVVSVARYTGKMPVPLLICLMSLASLAAAQEKGSRQLIVPLADGGFVAFKAETTLTETKKASDTQSTRAVFESQVLVDDKQIIHRLLVDAEGRPVFGYDLFVSANPTAKQFRVAARPLDPQFESRVLARAGGSQAATKIATLPQSSEAQLLDDGDAFSLDLLVNSDAGIKIVDLVKVSFDRATLWNVNPRTLPRDFTLDAVQLTVKEYQLVLNGKVVASSKSTTGCSGALIWFYVPDHGRFIFSLVPRDGYQFQKVGSVAGNRIEFTIGKDHYEWVSSSSVLSDSGAWNLWVLHDPWYVPLIWTPERPDKKKDRWDKLDSAFRTAREDAAMMRSQKQTTFQNFPDQRSAQPKSHVMVGGADKIENLWPQ
jgi:hypothetical protein